MRITKRGFFYLLAIIVSMLFGSASVANADSADSGYDGEVHIESIEEFNEEYNYKDRKKVRYSYNGDKIVGVEYFGSSMLKGNETFKYKVVNYKNPTKENVESGIRLIEKDLIGISDKSAEDEPEKEFNLSPGKFWFFALITISMIFSVIKS